MTYKRALLGITTICLIILICGGFYFLAGKIKPEVPKSHAESRNTFAMLVGDMEHDEIEPVKEELPKFHIECVPSPDIAFKTSVGKNYILPVLTGDFEGYSDEYHAHRGKYRHTGLDIPVRSGSPVLAANSGEVVFTGSSDVTGNIIVLKHTFDDGSVQFTLYSHLNRILVSNGERVKAAHQIAKAGSTGVSTGPHLHFEIRNSMQLPLNSIDDVMQSWDGKACSAKCSASCLPDTSRTHDNCPICGGRGQPCPYSVNPKTYINPHLPQDESALQKFSICM